MHDAVARPGSPAADENARLNHTMDGQDGSVAEVELTADFTGLRRRVLGALSVQG
jgi:hypothetical protein